MVARHLRQREATVAAVARLDRRAGQRVGERPDQAGRQRDAQPSGVTPPDAPGGSGRPLTIERGGAAARTPISLAQVSAAAAARAPSAAERPGPHPAAPRASAPAATPPFASTWTASRRWPFAAATSPTRRFRRERALPVTKKAIRPRLAGRPPNPNVAAPRPAAARPPSAVSAPRRQPAPATSAPRPTASSARPVVAPAGPNARQPAGRPGGGSGPANGRLGSVPSTVRAINSARASRAATVCSAA